MSEITPALNECVAVGTRVLTADLHWVPAGEVAAGDSLLAFSENARDASREGYKRRSRLHLLTSVVAATRTTRPCYDLEFDDGTVVRCSVEHRWLVGANKAAHWVTTGNLALRNGQASRAIKPLDVWRTETSREAGYLAAAFDGEGDITQRELSGLTKGVTGTMLGFSQVDNAMLAEAERCLKELGFEYGHHVQPRAKPTLQDVHRLNICRRPEFLRLLGAVRPVRLLAKFHPDRLGALSSARTVRLVSKTFAGPQELIALQTASRTFFAEGLASHSGSGI